MVFDLPEHKGNFTERITEMKKQIKLSNSNSLAMIKQIKLNNLTELQQALKQVVKSKGEGLMLHHQNAYYHVGRSSQLMKLKQYQDAEATVINHISGKGKYHQQLGALLVKTTEGITFKIGTGFSDQQRRQPPPIGSTITYKYIGKTQRGVPRFASFLRIRPLDHISDGM
jgi:DNA ligase-1